MNYHMKNLGKKLADMSTWVPDVWDHLTSTTTSCLPMPFCTKKEKPTLPELEPWRSSRISSINANIEFCKALSFFPKRCNSVSRNSFSDSKSLSTSFSPFSMFLWKSRHDLVKPSLSKNNWVSYMQKLAKVNCTMFNCQYYLFGQSQLWENCHISCLLFWGSQSSLEWISTICFSRS